MKRGRPKKGTTKGRATATPRPLHWTRRSSMTQDMTLCGQTAALMLMAATWAEVTCKACRRYGEQNPSHQRPASTNLDSLIKRAFKETEGELAVALVEAEHALNAALRPGDVHEICAQLGGALRRLVDLLNPKQDG